MEYLLLLDSHIYIYVYIYIYIYIYIYARGSVVTFARLLYLTYTTPAAAAVEISRPRGVYPPPQQQFGSQVRGVIPPPLQQLDLKPGWVSPP